MNLQRLEVFDAIVRCDFSVSQAARDLRQSQPGLSKHLQLLEQELGFSLFARRGRRLVGLTEPGREAYRIARRMLRDQESLFSVGQELGRAEEGFLTVATTHTQARYALPEVIVEFRRRFPRVKLALHQGSPSQVIDEVRAGRADIALATEGIADEPELVALPYYEWNRAVLAPRGHPLLAKEALTLEELAKYPIVTYAFAFTGRSQINSAFAARGIQPEVVLSAIDADIIKTYVRLGFGVGIVAKMAYDGTADADLGMLDASHLFPTATTMVGLRRGTYLKGYCAAFIELLAPHLRRELVEEALHH